MGNIPSAWRSRGFLGAAGSIWALGCLLPGLLLVHGDPGANPRRMTGALSALYGREAAAYLAYCPVPLIAYVRGLLFFTPVIVLLAAVGLRGTGSPTPRNAVTRPAVLALAWIGCSTTGFLLLCAAVAGRTGLATAWGWSWRLGAAAAISGLPAIGVCSLVVLAVRSPLRALGVGLVISGLVGFLHFLLRDAHWVPGQIDRDLLTGAGGVPWRPVLFASAWFVIGAAGSIGLHKLWARRSARRAATATAGGTALTA
jgi:hypothetical protein